MDSSELIFESCKKMGISLSPLQQKQFQQYQELLLSWNEKMNLTAITQPQEIAIKHFADSVSIGAKGIIDFDNKSAVDIGTGAGFPGIPLKIVFPSLQMTLLDSLQKRISFLSAVINELQLDGITAIHSRAEDAGKDLAYREQFDYALSRAVAPMAVLAEYCLPFVKVGGMLLSLKGSDVALEMEEAKSAISQLGGEIVSVMPVDIPLSDLHHSLVILKKIGQTPMQFPRKAGKVVKNPIK